MKSKDMPPTRSTELPILVFAKPPVAGTSKTRLGREIGDAPAARFAGAFLQDTLERVHRGEWNPVWLVGDSATSAPFAAFLASGSRFVSQGPGDLGARLRRAFTQVRKEGYAGAIALGADTPHLPIERLSQARDAILRGRVVLGPATDGGYYLLGLPAGAEEVPGLLDRPEWGTPRVLEMTRAVLGSSSWSTLELEPFWDIDHLRDLVQLKHMSFDGEKHGPAPEHSLRLLEGLEEL